MKICDLLRGPLASLVDQPSKLCYADRIEMGEDIIVG